MIPLVVFAILTSASVNAMSAAGLGVAGSAMNSLRADFLRRRASLDAKRAALDQECLLVEKLFAEAQTLPVQERMAFIRRHPLSAKAVAALRDDLGISDHERAEYERLIKVDRKTFFDAHGYVFYHLDSDCSALKYYYHRDEKLDAINDLYIDISRITYHRPECGRRVFTQFLGMVENMKGGDSYFRCESRGKLKEYKDFILLKGFTEDQVRNFFAQFKIGISDSIEILESLFSWCL